MQVSRRDFLWACSAAGLALPAVGRQADAAAAMVPLNGLTCLEVCINSGPALRRFLDSAYPELRCSRAAHCAFFEACLQGSGTATNRQFRAMLSGQPGLTWMMSGPTSGAVRLTDGSELALGACLSQRFFFVKLVNAAQNGPHMRFVCAVRRHLPGAPIAACERYRKVL
ncbi:MAG TPA: twin-arginine translocation signal domain-containing protein [Oligoflexia bacterium]|nr:twin-arginine translocation signal domain-containing protein [Oligoflexia bacterium]